MSASLLAGPAPRQHAPQRGIGPPSCSAAWPIWSGGMAVPPRRRGVGHGDDEADCAAR